MPGGMILLASRTRAVTSVEAQALLRQFHLGRRELLDEIEAAGRKPEMYRGGWLQTSEPGVPTYPKVYDMMSLDPETTAYLQVKFGKLHVNRVAGHPAIPPKRTDRWVPCCGG